MENGLRTAPETQQTTKTRDSEIAWVPERLRLVACTHPVLIPHGKVEAGRDKKAESTGEEVFVCVVGET